MAKPRLLLIPSWFPTPDKPGFGVFVKRHAEEIAEVCDVVILNFDLTDNPRVTKSIRTEHHINESLTEVQISIPSGKSLLLKIFTVVSIYMEFLRFKARFKYTEFDIVNIHVPYNIAVILSPFILFSNKLLVINEHWSGYFEEDGRYFRTGIITRVILRLLFKKAKYVSVISIALKKRIDEIFNLKEKLVVIPNKLSEIKAPRELTESMDEMKTFLFIGNFNDDEKNISGLINAFADAVNVRSDIRLVLVGDGNDFEAMKQLANQRNIPDGRIVFKGFIPPDELEALYRISVCYILNSYFETFSISTAEALLWGVPVIATRCKGPEEYVDDSNGILINVGNEIELENAILKMADTFRTYDPDKVHRSINSKYPKKLAPLFYEIFKNDLK